MKKTRQNLKKSEIAMVNRYMRWYRVIENELRLFVNEEAINDNKERINILEWKENKAYLCVRDMDYCKNFYEKHKDLEVKFFLKSGAADLYSEYEVKEWKLSENGIEVDFY